MGSHGGDIVELIELYGTLATARERKALIAVARIMAAQPNAPAPGDAMAEPEEPQP